MPISVGIPFYNAESYLPDAIRSVLAQTYQEWELILIDDGSTDRSLEIAHSIKDARVRVLSDGENRRLGFRLNQIVNEARYDIVGRMDADDMMSPYRLAKEVEILNKYPRIDLVTTGICSITNDNRPVGIRVGSNPNLISGRNLLLGRCMVTHAAIVGRRLWFLRNRYDVSTDRLEDYELWLRAYSLNDFSIAILNEPLYYYREQQNVTSERILPAYAGQRRLMSQYGYLGFNRIEMPLQIARIYLKALVVNVLSSCNRLDLLLKQRNTSIKDPKVIEQFNCEIRQVLETHLPGLD